MKNLASYDVKKPSKTNALNLINLLHTDSICDDDKGVILAQLYQYFIPATPAKPKTAEQWIAKAVPKKDIRYFLQYLYSDGSNLVGTDGHRMHYVENMDYDAGSYNIVMDKIDPMHAGKYPNWERVVPNTSKSTPYGFNTLTLKTIELKGIKNAKNKWNYEIYNYRGDLLLTVNKSYLDDALSFMDNPTVYYTSKIDSILISDGRVKAVVMPVRATK